MTYSWTIIQKPSGSTATLATPDQVSTSINIDWTGEYRIQLVVTDSKGLILKPIGPNQPGLSFGEFADEREYIFMEGLSGIRRMLGNQFFQPSL